ncbi:MAG: redoxin domain-containing protein, partial [Alphaproteobacteria bacterium]|nr:redoxin domain-containing protein [Alphaproteobacteria bacterium]
MGATGGLKIDGDSEEAPLAQARMPDVPLPTPGDRVPNLFLPDQRGVVISLADKSRGGPIALLFYPTRRDPAAAAEMQAIGRLAPELLAAGAHLFTIGGDSEADTVAFALRSGIGAGVHACADPEGRAAANCSLTGRLAGLVLDPNQRITEVLLPRDGPIVARAAERVRAWTLPQSFAAPMHPPILIIPDALEPDFCRYLIEQYELRGNKVSGTQRTVDGRMVHDTSGETKRRRDHHVEDAYLMGAIGTRIGRRVLPEIRRAFHCDASQVEEFKIVCYDSEPGGWFLPHRDNTTPGTAHRRFAMTLNLNTGEYDGGELWFPEYGGATYALAAGTAVIFSCALLHEAKPVTRGSRFVLLSFFFDEAGRRLRERLQQQIAASR